MEKRGVIDPEVTPADKILPATPTKQASSKYTPPTAAALDDDFTRKTADAVTEGHREYGSEKR